MRKTTLAAMLALGSTLAVAQAVPPMDCGVTPEYPGRLGSSYQKQTYDKALKAYEKCVKAYVEQRQVASKAHFDAAQKAIDDYNALVMKARIDSGENVDASKSAPTPTAPPSSGGKY